MISVAMATYNGASYVEKQIKSILEQSMPIDELIVCDDCSLDETVKIIEHLSINDRRIKLHINKNNIGYISNFYQAISMTSGKYIFLADQDDIWEYNKVERMMQVLGDLEAEVLCTNFKIIDSQDKESNHSYIIPEFIQNTSQPIKKIDFYELLYGNVAQGCTYCFSENIKNIFININNHEVIHDYQLMLIGAAFDKAFYLNEKLIKYRMHGENSIGFSEKKTLKNVKFRLPFNKPKVVAFLESLKLYRPEKKFWKSYIILYLRLPVWIAVIKRFF